MIVFLKGGLGNQLFQLHKALCDKKEEDVIVLDSCFLQTYPSPRSFELGFLVDNKNIFCRNSRFLSVKRIRYLFEILARARILTGDNGKGIFSKVYFGYFQRKSYFTAPESTYALRLIRLNMIQQITISQDTLSRLITRTGYHIRLGDRMNGNEVPSEVVSYLKTNSTKEKILVFSDSPDILRDLLLENNVEFIADYKLSLLQEFRILTEMDNVYISASTFSLFARLLSAGGVNFLPANYSLGDLVLQRSFA